MKYLSTVLLVLVLLAPASYAQPLQFPRPPQAPAAKKAKAEPCPCTGKADCTCDPAACFCRACSGRKTVKTVDCGCLRGGLCRCPVSTGCHCDTIPGQDSKATTYTGTLNLAYTLPAGSHGWGLRYSVITDTDIPAGTYMLTAVPKGAQARMPYDTTTIYRCPETGRRWRYVDQQGNWEIVPELPISQYQLAPSVIRQPQFMPMSFGGGGARGGSC